MVISLSVQGEKKKPFSYGEITLSKEGVWYHEGVEVTHKRTIELFNRSIQREGDGYVLRVGREVCPVEVEDAPYLVMEVDSKGDSLLLRLSNSTTVTLDPQTLEIGEKNVMYAWVNSQRDRARFTRPAYYQLAKYIHQDPDEQYILRVGKTDYPLNISP